MAEYIGVDIGQYSVKVAHIRKAGKSFVCNNMIYEVLPEAVRRGTDKGGLKKLITNILKFHKINKGLPVLHISSSDALMRNITVPENTTKEQLESSIEMELAPSLPFPMDQVYYDFDEDVGPDGSHLVIAGRRDIIDAKTSLFSEKAKTLEDPQVDLDVFAFERLFQSLIASGDISGENVAVVDIGYLRTRISVYQNGRYVFVRDAQIGGNQATEMIRDVYDVDLETAETKKLNLTVDDEYNNLVLKPYVASFAEQLNLAIDFYEASGISAKALDRIYLVGGGALLHGLVDRLRDSVSAPVELLNIKNKLKVRSDIDGKQLSLSGALAMGLAMEAK